MFCYRCSVRYLSHIASYIIQVLYNSVDTNIHDIKNKTKWYHNSNIREIEIEKLIKSGRRGELSGYIGLGRELLEEFGGELSP